MLGERERDSPYGTEVGNKTVQNHVYISKQNYKNKNKYGWLCYCGGITDHLDFRVIILTETFLYFSSLTCSVKNPRNSYCLPTLYLTAQHRTQTGCCGDREAALHPAWQAALPIRGDI